jgi:hypothetical protein
MNKLSRLTVSLALAFIIVAAFMPVDSAQADAPFRLPANMEWMDSGFDVTAGQSVTITAFGNALTGPLKDYPDAHSNPDGQITNCSLIVPGHDCAPYGALIGRIGVSGTPFLIGSSFTFTPSVSGDLYLAVNDNLFDYVDNHGNFIVFIAP